MSDPTTAELLSPLHASAPMRAILSSRARLQRMLDFEAALARAEGAAGIISATDAVVISAACVADHFDLPAMAETARLSGDFVAVLVETLSADVARHSTTAANFVHWGASSQDVIDTALMLELRAVIDVLVIDIDAAMKGFTTLAGRHRRTVAAARTMLQHRQPIPHGLKLAGYAAALGRSRERLWRLRRDALMLQFGGTAGTLAPLGERGGAVADRLAALLDLQLPEAPWHSYRDRFAEVGASIAILAGTCGKIARDIALLTQIEVGEASARTNPTAAAAALSAAALAPNLAAALLAQVHEHEGRLGSMQTEWLTFPALALVTSGALDAVVKIAESLEIDVERTRANLERSGGQIMTEAVSYALAERMGRVDAIALIRELAQRASEAGKPLRDVLLAEPRVKAYLSTTEIDKLFVPLAHLGSSQTFIDRLVYAAQPRSQRRPDFRPAEPRLPITPTLPPVAAAETETTREVPPTAPVVAPDPAPAPAATAAEPKPAVAEAVPGPAPAPVVTTPEPEPVEAAPEPAPPAVTTPQPAAPPAVTAPEPAPPAPDPQPAPPEPPTLQEPASEAAPSLAAEPSPHGPAETAPPAPAARTEPPPAPSKPKPLPDEDAPGALMDVLWRAAEEERKRS